MPNRRIFPISLTGLLILSMALVGGGDVIAGTSVPITRISFAGAGGDFSHRYGTFTVPDKDTSRSAYGGTLRRYDVHISKMIEIAHFQWCQTRTPYQGVYYSYESGNGKVFMGQIYISCATAKNAINTFGVGRPEPTIIFDRDRPNTINIPVLDLNGSKIAKFKRFVQSIQPQCVNRRCPGDRLP
jgi:hypothetical protein